MPRKPKQSKQSDADARVMVEHTAEGAIIGIPVSKEFSYTTLDCDNPGIDYMDASRVQLNTGPEPEQAENALRKAIASEITSGRGLLSWLRGALARRGGGKGAIQRLARDLVPLYPPRSKPLKDPIGAEVRALQRLQPGAKREQHKGVSGPRANAIVALALREGEHTLALLADWQISENIWSCHQADWQGPERGKDAGAVASALVGRESMIGVVRDHMYIFLRMDLKNLKGIRVDLFL